MRRSSAIVAAAALALACTAAREVVAAPVVDAEGEGTQAAADRRLAEVAARGRYVHLVGTAMVGDGLRFDNPYRLRTVLGSSAESLSLTAPYVDLGVGAALGAPDGVQHGAHLALSASLVGVPQQVLTPAYLVVLRSRRPWLVYARAGLPVLLAPDANVGGELAAGVGWFVTGGVALGAALVGDGFYGAATRETRAAFYPVLSAQFGLTIDYEVLP